MLVMTSSSDQSDGLSVLNSDNGSVSLDCPQENLND